MHAGDQTFPNSFYRFVDIRDVANAHIQALEVPSATGRYCLVETVIHCSEVMKLLHKLYPTLCHPGKCDDKPSIAGYQVSKEKAKSLGINFIPLEVTLKDTVENLKQKGFLSF
ncbi:phenylacetaldehyde reductase-like [Corylus avellana]|uniref:phenylacetaldehyde reductase-like n=1 Tax=Corylus avellana TaxID=13451 RepID=UPI00286C82CD|nr:phenylacetaldehyde reductase-like [Corylus avellana]